MSEFMRISKRHYDIIINQVIKNFPQECGGFLGGSDDTIKAILPTFNQHLFDKTDTFAFTGEDVIRAHKMFEKHGLSYYGTYHSHPKSIPYPSKQDILVKQPYHFIIGINENEPPVFAVYKMEGAYPKPIPLDVIDNRLVDVVDIHGTNKKEDASQKADVDQPKTPEQEAEYLGQLMQDMKDEKLQYPKLKPHHLDNGDFTTLA